MQDYSEYVEKAMEEKVLKPIINFTSDVIPCGVGLTIDGEPIINMEEFNSHTHPENKPFQSDEDEYPEDEDNFFDDELILTRKRGELLDEAKEVINGERQDQYGSPENSFQLIADYWNTYIIHGMESNPDSFHITPLDVAHMMMLFKIARMQGQKPSRDNYRDVAGYSSIAADVLLK